MSTLKRHLERWQKTWRDDKAVMLTKEQCTKLSRYQGPIDECGVVPLGNAKAGMLVVVNQCGGDACEVHRWVFPTSLPGPRALPVALVGYYRLFAGVEIDPSQTFVFIDSIDITPTEEHHGGVVMFRLSDGSQQPREGSFAYTLSPGERWFVCRDAKANVLRVPVLGGSPETIALAGVPPADVAWGGGAFDYPKAVRFRDAQTIEVSLSVHDQSNLFSIDNGGNFIGLLPWRENGPMPPIETHWVVPEAKRYPQRRVRAARAPSTKRGNRSLAR